MSLAKKYKMCSIPEEYFLRVFYFIFLNIGSIIIQKFNLKPMNKVQKISLRTAKMAKSAHKPINGKLCTLSTYNIYTGPKAVSSIGWVADSDQRGTWFESHSLHYTKISLILYAQTLPTYCPYHLQWYGVMVVWAMYGQCMGTFEPSFYDI